MRRRRRHGNTPTGPIAVIPGVVVALFVVIFGIFWTVQASSMGAPGIFTLFGIGFVLIALMGLISVVAAALKGGMQNTSPYEDDPPVVLYSPEPETYETDRTSQVDRECSYCGARVEGTERRCPNCGAGI